MDEQVTNVEKEPARRTGRDTDDLLRALESARGLTGVLRELSADMDAPSFPKRLAELMGERSMTVTQLSEAALLSRSFTYQLCSGERAPSRDMVLRLALVMELTVDETQRLLRTAQKGALYPRVTRDAVVIFALKEHMGIQAADEQLLLRGEESLL